MGVEICGRNETAEPMLMTTPPWPPLSFPRNWSAKSVPRMAPFCATKFCINSAHFSFQKKHKYGTTCTYQIYINFQFPKFIIHNFCIVDHNIETIKLTDCRLKCLFVLHIIGDIAMTKKNTILSKRTGKFVSSIFTSIWVQVANRHLQYG